MDDALEDGGYYWDHRTNKALKVIEKDDKTVTFESVWHREEANDAREGEVLVPIEDIGLDRVETTFDLIDSFRFQEDDDE